MPIVDFGGLVIASILFFTDLERQKQNMMPMLLLLISCFILFASGALLKRMNWEVTVMGAFAAALLAVCLVVLKKGFAREIIKRFHTR